MRAMSGYNLFISSYIARKNQSLEPFKLPDGTLFTGEFLLQENGDYIFQEDLDKIKL